MRNIIIKGETKSMSQWARQVGITCEAMRQRINKRGEDAGEDLLVKEVGRRNTNFYRQYGKTATEMAEAYNISIPTLKRKLERGELDGV